MLGVGRGRGRQGGYLGESGRWKKGKRWPKQRWPRRCLAVQGGRTVEGCWRGTRLLSGRVVLFRESRVGEKRGNCESVLVGIWVLKAKQRTRSAGRALQTLLRAQHAAVHHLPVDADPLVQDCFSMTPYPLFVNFQQTA